MASIRSLKKEINYVLGDLVNIVYVWEITHGGKPTADTDALVDEIYTKYDDLLTKINDKSVENRKAHVKQVRKDYEAVANEFVTKINALGL